MQYKNTKQNQLKNFLIYMKVALKIGPFFCKVIVGYKN